MSEHITSTTRLRIDITKEVSTDEWTVIQDIVADALNTRGYRGRVHDMAASRVVAIQRFNYVHWLKSKFKPH